MVQICWHLERLNITQIYSQSSVQIIDNSLGQDKGEEFLSENFNLNKSKFACTFDRIESSVKVMLSG